MLLAMQQQLKLVSGGAEDINGGVALSVDLLGDESGLVGYRAKRHTGLVDVDKSARLRRCSTTGSRSMRTASGG